MHKSRCRASARSYNQTREQNEKKERETQTTLEQRESVQAKEKRIRNKCKNYENEQHAKPFALLFHS